MRKYKKYIQRLQLQFVLLVLGKPDRQLRTRSAPSHSNFASNQRRQDIYFRLYEKGFSNSILFQQFNRVFVV